MKSKDKNNFETWKEFYFLRNFFSVFARSLLLLLLLPERVVP